MTQDPRIGKEYYDSTAYFDDPEHLTPTDVEVDAVVDDGGSELRPQSLDADHGRRLTGHGGYTPT